MIRAGSHLVIATDDVPRMRVFFEGVFSLSPHFANDMFCEFVLPSRFRIAFFKPVGKAAQFFDAAGPRHGCSFGVTVANVDALFARIGRMEKPPRTSGPPKDHPWGERSFLLIDPDGNRWEVTQTPSADGMLVDRDG